MDEADSQGVVQGEQQLLSAASQPGRQGWLRQPVLAGASLLCRELGVLLLLLLLRCTDLLQRCGTVRLAQVAGVGAKVGGARGELGRPGECSSQHSALLGGAAEQGSLG